MTTNIGVRQNASIYEKSVKIVTEFEDYFYIKKCYEMLFSNLIYDCKEFSILVCIPSLVISV